LSDTTGSFDLAFYGAGSMTFLSGLMLFIAPYLVRFDSPSSGRPSRTHHVPALDQRTDDQTSSSTVERWRQVLDRHLAGKFRTITTSHTGVDSHHGDGELRHHRTTIDIVVTGDAETGEVLTTQLVDQHQGLPLSH